MSSSGKSFWNNTDARLNSPNKVTTLNPHAAEFVPSAFRSLPGNNSKVDEARLEVAGTPGNSVSNQSVHSISNNSDDEAHQYWFHQLPDDITPDFKGMGAELRAPVGLSLAGLSINDGVETSRFSLTMGNHLLGIHKAISPRGIEYKSLNKRMGYSGLPLTEDHSAALVNLHTTSVEKQVTNGDLHLTNDRELGHYGGTSNAGFVTGSSSEHAVLRSSTVNPVEFLVSQFPGLAAESLAELYYANGCDMTLTMKMLTQLQLKVDNNSNQMMNSRTLHASILEPDFPAFSVPDSEKGLSKYSGQDLPQAKTAFCCVDSGGFSLFKSIPSAESMGSPDFAPAVHRLASQCARNGSTGAGIGSSINSQLLTSSDNGHGKTTFADKLQGLGTALAPSSWFETGDAMDQIYSEMREESRDVAQLQNACFDQAKQAYVSGNRAFAKELSLKGQYNIQVKEAQDNGRESIYRQRNPVAQPQSYNQVQDPFIDLHGLHVNEAIHVLKHELSILRRTARSAGRRLQVMVRVGTGPHIRGSRSLVRLPIAIQQYLLDENLQFTEDQPGLLRVVIC